MGAKEPKVEQILAMVCSLNEHTLKDLKKSIRCLFDFAEITENILIEIADDEDEQSIIKHNNVIEHLKLARANIEKVSNYLCYYVLLNALKLKNTKNGVEFISYIICAFSDDGCLEADKKFLEYRDTINKAKEVMNNESN